MSTPCTTCGEPLDPAVDRCPACTALASPSVEETAVTDPDATRVVAAPPWSIPIREPAATVPSTSRPASGRGPRVAVVAVVVVVVVVLALLAGSRLLDSADDTGTASGATPSGDPVETDSAGTDPGFAARETTTTTAAATPATTQTTGATSSATVPAPVAPTTSTAPTTSAPQASPARTGPNGTGSVPALSTGFRGWLAQLTSVPFEAGTDGLSDEWQRLRGAVPGAVAARSNDWAAFRDGFWVLVDPGPFGSADEVRAFCASAGFDGDAACLPRELRG